MGGRYQAKKKSNGSYSNGDQDYGLNCNKPDMTTEELEAAKVAYVERNLNLNETELHQLHEKTKGQSRNDNWVYERTNRITSTYFHRIASRKSSTKTAPIVKAIRNGGCGFQSVAMLRGLQLEPVALAVYESKLGMPIVKGEEMGLLIHSNFQYLAASLDGCLLDGTPVEVKTVNNIPQGKTIREAANEKGLVKNFFLVPSHSGLQLKKNHKYYGQIQGQLEIANRDECHLVVFHNEHDWEVVVVPRSREYWSRILPKLDQFWNESLLPEILDSRILRSMSIREPPSVLAALKNKSSGPADRPGLKRKENTEPVIAKKMRVLKPKRKNMEAEHWSDSDSLDLSEIDWSDDESE
jgi:hypothetical protein